jgi:hypothetical protein
MFDIAESEIHAALQDAGIEYELSTIAGHEPIHEFYTDFEIELYGDEWATLTSYWVTTIPTFVNVRVEDYNRAVELLIALEGREWDI